jgi:hypothetical protein
MALLAFRHSSLQVAPNLAVHKSANIFLHGRANFSCKVPTAFLLLVALFRKTYKNGNPAAR